MRFEERYQASVEKELRRREEGKREHQTIIRSMDENKARLEMTRTIRRISLEKTNKSNAYKKKNEA